jgi:SAM-dependent methyltransferase
LDKFEQSLQYTSAIAKRLGVSGEIHRNDFIYKFVLGHPCFPTVEGAVSYYFENGRQSTLMLSELLEKLAYDLKGPLTMLEFASGYGCLTRHLHVVLPGVRSTACDIHREAVDFISNILRQPAILSNSVPEQLDSKRKYDVVFALSFFSHMPRSTWGRWISALYNAVAKGGVLLFTTHGNVSRKYFGNPDIPKDGFWFKTVSEQVDLDTAEYGSTLVTKEFVERELDSRIGQPITLYREAHWWSHQDLYAVVKR